MSAYTRGNSDLSLRVITDAISSTSAQDIPSLAFFLTSALENCGRILLTAQNEKGQSGNADIGVQLHKYKTQISALLQGKAAEGRWMGVVLVKASVEAGDWQILQNCGPWVRSLLGILGKRDPPTTKTLCIIALARIFLLNHEYQTLVREISTPNLPTFIASCLNLITVQPAGAQGKNVLDTFSPFLALVLHTFYRLLPHHPTIFRPYAGRIQGLLLPLVAATQCGATSTIDASSSEAKNIVLPHVSNSARKLFVRLHYCAPKNQAGEEWASACNAVITNSHGTADHVFRSILEDWEPTARLEEKTSTRDITSGVVGQRDVSQLGLPSWTGIVSGVQRISGLLSLLEEFINEPNATTVQFPVGSIVDLLTRLLMPIVPSEEVMRNGEAGPRINPEIGREEREGLWAGLPQFHVAALSLLIKLMDRLGYMFIPLAQEFLDLVLWVHRAENMHREIRRTAYIATGKIFKLNGSSLAASSSSSLGLLIQQCCADVQPGKDGSGTLQSCTTYKGKTEINGHNSKLSRNADAYLGTLPQKQSGIWTLPQSCAGYSELARAAWELLPLFLSCLPPDRLRFAWRAEIDRTAILVGHRSAMMASVLNPPRGKSTSRTLSSIMPHLARAYPAHSEVEALIRPRMPLVAATMNGDTASDEQIEDKESVDMNEVASVADSQMDDAEMGNDVPDFTGETALKTNNETVAAEQEPNAISGSMGLIMSQTNLPHIPTETIPERSQKRLSADDPPTQTWQNEESEEPETSPAASTAERTSKRQRFEQMQENTSVLGAPTAARTTVANEAHANATMATMSEQPLGPIEGAAGKTSSPPRTRNDSDSDDSFEIPELVIDADTEDEGDEDGDGDEGLDDEGE